MQILVIGAGAVGGYFGGRLAEAGCEVTFLVRPARAENLRRGGLRIVSSHGDATIQPQLVLPGEVMKRHDLILLSVKSYSLGAAMDDFAAAVGPGTIIFPLLNGMRHLDVLADRFGDEAVVGGVCLVNADVDPAGQIVQNGDPQTLVYGELGGGPSKRLEAVSATLHQAAFTVRVSENIRQEMWEKWVMLASLGAAMCLLRGNIGEIEAVPEGSDLALQILAECIAIATACGYPPSEAPVARLRTALTAKGSKQTTSTYRDLSKGLNVEVDNILGDFVERGRQAGVAAPLLAAACINLRIYQNRLATR